MKKLIGIADLCKEEVVSVGVNYANAVLRAGNVPVVLPRTDDVDAVRALVERIDVLLLAGGCDLDPATFGQAPSPFLGEVVAERDAFEFSLLAEAVRQRRPVLGICRGIQVINVYFGGTLYQDMPSELDPAMARHQRPDKPWEVVHPVRITAGSRLNGILGVTEAGVNSTHHQACRDIAPGFRVTAVADDGIVEAIESDTLPILGVQFHPERLVKLPDSPFTRLFSFA